MFLFISENIEDKLFVWIINFGEYSIDNALEHDETYVDDICVAIWKKERVKAFEFCAKPKGKGYKMSIQSMVFQLYTIVSVFLVWFMITRVLVGTQHRIR